MPRLGSGVPMVARRRELAALEAALGRARDGHAAAVLVSGDAGVGKSRLLSELVALAADADDVVVLSGGCLDAAEAALPYLPFVEALRDLARARPDLLDTHPTLARLLPDAVPADHPAHHDRDLGQLQLFDALLSAMGGLDGDRTVLLTIEDLHWADRSSRDLLSFLLSRLSTQRLLIVGTFRADDLHRRHPLRPLLAELFRLPAVERVALDPFGAADAESFVRSLADDTVTDDVVRSVAARSEGNAFLAEELISACSGDVPHDLAEILLARVERLTPAAQRVVRLGAVLGRRFTHARAAAASDLPDDELELALRDAVAHHVLVGGDGGDYAFRHALLREAVHGDLLPGERTRLHARAADAIAGETGPGAAAELAHHRMESHDLPGALVASWRAALEADALEAPAETLLHAERALKLWHAVPDAAALVGVDEATVVRYAAWGASASGEPDRALAHARAAVALIDSATEPERAADMRRRFATYLLDLNGTAAEAYRVVREAMALVADEEPSVVKAWVLAVAARAAAGVDHDDEAIALGAAAQDVARAVPGAVEAAKAAEADALASVAGFRWRRGDADGAHELLARSMTIATMIDAPGVELRARFRIALVHVESGRLAAAIPELQAALRRAADSGLTWSTIGLELRVLLVMAQFMSGDWDGAEATATLGGEDVSDTVATRVTAAELLVAVGRGRPDAERRLAHLRERWQTDTQVMRLVGTCGAELELWRGRPDKAARSVEQALLWLRQYEPWHLGEIALCSIGVAAYADLAAAARRDRDAAAERDAIAGGTALADRAAAAMVNGEPQAGEVGPEAIAWMRRVDAEAARLRGEPSAQQWAVVDDAFGYGETYRQAYARWRGAEAVLAAGGDRSHAADLLRSAAAIADDLDAAPLRGAVAALARRARLQLGAAANGVPAAGSSAAVLTRRERSVLTLVADGRTNRQIGDELFISEKTVSVHVSRVMAKLGAASRTEAVSEAYHRGLLTT